MRCLRLLLFVIVGSSGLVTGSCSTKSSGLGPVDANRGVGEEDADTTPLPDRPAPVPDRPADMPAPADGSGQEASQDGVRTDSAGDVNPSDAEAGNPGDTRPSDMRPADMARDMAPDRPPTNLARGAACDATSQCQNGLFCVRTPGAAPGEKGVCCNEACNNGCKACVRARTGSSDGTCAIDRELDRKPCGAVCGQIFMDVPAVVEKLCGNGECVVPAVPRVIDTCRKDDPCIRSFCDNSDTRNPVCRHSVCPMQGACCCAAAGGAGRMCASTASCTGMRSCQPNP